MGRGLLIRLFMCPSMKTANNQVRSSHAGATPLKRLLATCGFNFRHDGAQRDWSTWHRRYNENEHLKARLQVVRQTVRAVLDDCRTGKIRLISICSGDGRDILEELAKHPRRNDIEAWLIDSDRPSIVRGEAMAAEVGLTRTSSFPSGRRGCGTELYQHSSSRSIAAIGLPDGSL